VYFYRNCVREFRWLFMACYGITCVSQRVRSSTKTDWKYFVLHVAKFDAWCMYRMARIFSIDMITGWQDLAVSIIPALDSYNLSSALTVPYAPQRNPTFAKNTKRILNLSRYHLMQFSQSLLGGTTNQWSPEQYIGLLWRIEYTCLHGSLRISTSTIPNSFQNADLLSEKHQM
jgi:hypothetical protein